MASPLFSIIIPVYNGEKYILRAIDSLFRQEDIYREDREIIVINDGSTDSTNELLKGYEKEIIMIGRDINMGLVWSVNEGIKIAKGKYVMRLDADDELYSSALCTHRAYLKDNDCDFTYSDHMLIYPKGNREEYISVKGNYLSLIAIGIAFKRDIFEKVGYYSNVFWEEHDFMLKVISKGFRGVYIAKPLIRYYRHYTNMTNNEKRRLKGWKELIDKWGKGSVDAIGNCPEIQKAIKIGV